MFGQSAQSCRSRGERATSPCLILRSIASSGAVISLASGSRTLHHTDAALIARRSVRFEITEQTREAIDAYIKLTRKDLGDFLFGGRRDRGMTTRQYARLVASWVASIG